MGSREGLASLQMSINTYYNNATYFPFLLYYICALEISNLDSLIFMSPPHISIASVSDQLKHELIESPVIPIVVYILGVVGGKPSVLHFTNTYRISLSLISNKYSKQICCDIKIAKSLQCPDLCDNE